MMRLSFCLMLSSIAMTARDCGLAVDAAGGVPEVTLVGCVYLMATTSL